MSVQSIRSTHEPSRLGIAFITALLLHGAALTAVTLWPSDTTDTPGEQEITIDLAPAMEEIVSVAPAAVQAQEVPPIETEPVPVETETVEDQPQEVTELQEPEQVTEVAPVEALPVKPETTETEAVVALPPPEMVVAKPLEEKPTPKEEPPPKPVERKRPPRRTVAEQNPPQAAQQGQASASRENMNGSAASADPAARGRYFASLRATLRNRLRYPDVVQSQGIGGVAHIRFTIDNSGRIVGSSLVRGTGNPALDQAALATAPPGSSVPSAPESVPERSFTIPLRFDLR